MWYLKLIPKTLHVYWGGGKISYLRYLTIESFHHYNPDWEICFYYPKISITSRSWGTPEQKYKDNWEDWMPMIDSSYVKMIQVLWDEPEYRKMSEVHRSDILRLKLLSTVGGLWADLDILFFRSIDSWVSNTPANSDKKTVMCISGYGHSIGFLMGSKNNSSFGKLEKESLKLYNASKYQCMGAELYNKLFPTISSIPDGVNLGMEAVYFYDANWMRLIFGEASSPADNPNSIGIHWYAGGAQAGAFLARTNGGQNPDKSTLGKLITDYEFKDYGHILGR
jgi:hypothetical protein